MALWVHLCPWCGWSREGDSSTMLAPRCESCGGLLEAALAGAAGNGHPLARAVAAPRLSPAFGRLTRFVLVALLLFAAVRFGWNAGGFGLAVAVAGVVGLFTLPLIVGE